MLALVQAARPLHHVTDETMPNVLRRVPADRPDISDDRLVPRPEHGVRDSPERFARVPRPGHRHRHAIQHRLDRLERSVRLAHHPRHPADLPEAVVDLRLALDPFLELVDLADKRALLLPDRLAGVAEFLAHQRQRHREVLTLWLDVDRVAPPDREVEGAVQVDAPVRPEAIVLVVRHQHGRGAELVHHVARAADHRRRAPDGACLDDAGVPCQGQGERHDDPVGDERGEPLIHRGQRAHSRHPADEVRRHVSRGFADLEAHRYPRSISRLVRHRDGDLSPGVDAEEAVDDKLAAEELLLVRRAPPGDHLPVSYVRGVRHDGERGARLIADVDEEAEPLPRGGAGRIGRIVDDPRRAVVHDELLLEDAAHRVPEIVHAPGVDGDAFPRAGGERDVHQTVPRRSLRRAALRGEAPAVE